MRNGSAVLAVPDSPPLTAGVEHVIETHNLTKRYGDIVAVDGLNLRVRRGEVYGFVGPNGAGKTTSLRILVGLIRPSSGSATVLGAAAGSKAALAGTGAMIEEPAFYPYLSGTDNLRVLARHASISDAAIGNVLEQVELTSRAHDAFKTYSMGMKQRLGLAAALLKSPRLLILDEPTNGLDPEGIAGMRVLLRRLVDEDRSVILSSHLMTEVQQICDRIGIIRGGKIVAEGTLDELRGEEEIRVTASPMPQATRLLEALPFVGGVRVKDGSLYVRCDLARAAELNRVLVGAGVEVSELSSAQASLEEIFFEIVNQGGRNNE